MLLALAAQTACGSSESNTNPHGQQDAGTDLGADVAEDAPDIDAGVDADVDASADAATDAGQGCTSCHGSDQGSAPPQDLGGGTSTGLPGVGAHRAHGSPSVLFRTPQCDDCHVVPTQVDDPGHLGDPPADLTWGALASADGANPGYSNGKCSVYCHGQTLSGGSVTEPEWTLVGVGQAGCGACHGLPPPAPHPKTSSGTCNPCHDFDGAVPNDPSTHADGKVDLVGVTCEACHGSAQSYAPPKDTQGNTSTTATGVGAHQTHLTTAALFRTVLCADCHKVPGVYSDPGHLDPLPAELTWGPTAKADGVTPSYGSGKCSVYCHGKSLEGGTLTEPEWTKVGSGQAACGSCHGLPPPKPHPTVSPTSCGPCHDFTQLVPNKPATHVDGKVDVAACGECHAVPPATGAHSIHYGDISSPPLASYGDTTAVQDYLPSGAPYYAFGCGNCHPIDPAKHFNGSVDVELSDPAAPSGSLKSLSPSTASYTGGSCSDVYCHSSGQATPTFVTSPAWNGGTLPAPRCAACHDNPPSYPSGGAGTATANTHVQEWSATEAWGHFAGMSGLHGNKHGGVGSSPLTCQTCHFDTVDPSNVAPGGFYYLDTTVDINLGGAASYDCNNAGCHDGASGSPASGTGAVRTAKHVNGKRDVVFDPRESIPAWVTGLPAPPNRPLYPLWSANGFSSYIPPGAVMTGTTWSATLKGASYDPANKTCSSIPCHLKQSYGTGKPSYDPLTWGAAYSCNACHQY
ncbi:MAG: CxxxxCH/CxxCH domain-containing protein [Polyangiaceae bacterium]